jgi:hypothetical protein
MASVGAIYGSRARVEAGEFRVDRMRVADATKYMGCSLTRPGGRRGFRGMPIKGLCWAHWEAATG